MSGKINTNDRHASPAAAKAIAAAGRCDQCDAESARINYTWEPTTRLCPSCADDAPEETAKPRPRKRRRTNARRKRTAAPKPKRPRREQTKP